MVNLIPYYIENGGVSKNVVINNIILAIKIMEAKELNYVMNGLILMFFMIGL